MHHEKIEKTGGVDYDSLFTATQKIFISIRKTSTTNDTIEISTIGNAEETDEVDPLRIHEIIIVICVLLLWCTSIYVFIRHSHILRIRHRDIPYRSDSKGPVNLNHIMITTRTSDAVLHRKSCISSTCGMTPPGEKRFVNESKVFGTIETISLSVSPSSRKRRFTPLLDRHILSITKHSLDKHDDKKQLLDPRHISMEVKENFVSLHHKSVENLSTIKHSTFHSVNACDFINKITLNIYMVKNDVYKSHLYKCPFQ
ncbi:hypothetical protein I4U23_020850 [Adineta vaga]|nr:hypothetical protein I4U23_020850 [Adineta vaga]